MGGILVTVVILIVWIFREILKDGEYGMWKTFHIDKKGREWKHKMIDEKEEYYIEDNYYGDYRTFKCRREQYETARDMCVYTEVRREGNKKIMIAHVELEDTCFKFKGVDD